MKPNSYQKHLTLEQRILIETGLAENKSFSEIARSIGKDPSTVSKEVRRHTMVKERNNISFAPIPCIHRKGCKLKNLCEDKCNYLCKSCRKKDMRCIYVCPSYETEQCNRLDKPPYVCNGCVKRNSCLKTRLFYSSKYADDCYRHTLTSSRQGINQTPESIQRLNDLLVPLLKDKHQSIAHVYATHADEIGCSRRTLYTYINMGVFDVRNIDLRRTVRYKKRKTSTTTSLKSRFHRKGHNYEDFQKYLQNNTHTSVIEMDCVEGSGKKSLLTMLFRNCHLMLIFLLDRQDQANVVKVFSKLESHLGQETFKKLFPVILTDGGPEFTARDEMEESIDGTNRTTIFYCDPYCFWQKGALEKNHEYIRYVLPKGTSFDNLTPEKVTLLMNHINNEKRDSLNGHSPHELSLLLLDNELHKQFGLTFIPPDEVNLSPNLLK